jgi:hypothetical protein
MLPAELADPKRLAGALYRLSSHPQSGDRAVLALRRNCWDLLFPQMVQDDDALREEARGIFSPFATSHEHARFAYSSRPNRTAGRDFSGDSRADESMRR